MGNFYALGPLDFLFPESDLIAHFILELKWHSEYLHREMFNWESGTHTVKHTNSKNFQKYCKVCCLQFYTKAPKTEINRANVT